MRIHTRPAAAPAIALAFAFASAVLAAPAFPAAAAGKPVDVSTLTKAQIRALGEDDEILVRGQPTTKRKAKAQLQQLRPQLDAKVDQGAAEGVARFHQFATQVDDGEKLKVQTANQKYQQGLAGIVAATPVPTCPSPKISGAFNSVVSPGMAILAVGCGFGKQTGEIALLGNFPGGELRLEKVEWHEGGVGGFVPMVTKVLDQDVKLVVRKAGGAASNTISLKFEPTLEARNLTYNEITYRCSGGADIDDCGPHAGRTFDARHANGIDFSDDVGDDVVKISLHNHWKADSLYWKSFWVGLGTGHLSDPTGFSKTSSNFEIDFHWAVPGGTYFGYYANVHVVGPKGFSPAN